MLYPPKMSITCWNITILLGSTVQPSFFLHFTHPHPALCSTSSTFIVHGFYHVSYPSGTMFMAKIFLLTHGPPGPRLHHLSNTTSAKIWSPVCSVSKSVRSSTRDSKERKRAGFRFCRRSCSCSLSWRFDSLPEEKDGNKNIKIWDLKQQKWRFWAAKTGKKTWNIGILMRNMCGFWQKTWL